MAESKAKRRGKVSRSKAKTRSAQRKRGSSSPAAARKKAKTAPTRKRRPAGKPSVKRKTAAKGRKAARRVKPAGKDRRGAKLKTTGGKKGPAAAVKQVVASEVGNAESRAKRREERNEQIKELIRLAEGQGYLTFEDINECLPESVIKAEEVESYIVLLREMDIEIIEASEVDKYRKNAAKEGKQHRPPKLDFFDDPIRMYLHQMGQVPLLTREQEVEICKRIEQAEIAVRRIFNRFGFATRMYLDLVERLEAGTERFDRVVVDKLVDNRVKYLGVLPRTKRDILRVRKRLEKQFMDHRRRKGSAASLALCRWGIDDSPQGDAVFTVRARERATRFCPSILNCR